MIMVRFILVDMTTPVRIRPRMEMSPVKGHCERARAVRVRVKWMRERSE